VALEVQAAEAAVTVAPVAPVAVTALVAPSGGMAAKTPPRV
jgi:hypothetical protein